MHVMHVFSCTSLLRIDMAQVSGILVVLFRGVSVSVTPCLFSPPRSDVT